ncbi:hypothetical protein [Agrobacterium sp. P15N1-A]|uniref:hypothetical protein n=1 Tax=Agrobacterium sp. P15N1-A TaxID=3342820 RepID=UPI0037D1CE12
MAESQVPFQYDQSSLKELRDSLSEPRFETYLKAAGNHPDHGAALYLYNSRLAKAFLFPLNIVEVTLRNRTNLILVKDFGDNWPTNPTFRNILDPEYGIRALDLAISRARGKGTGKVVAALTFDFWSNLFRPEYGDIWRFTLNIAFPHLPPGTTRQNIQDAVKVVNDFRNRIAHHEPILSENATTVQSTILKLVGYCNPTVRDWMRHHTTVGEVLRTRPTRSGANGTTLTSKLDKTFLVVNKDTTLDDLFHQIDHAHPAIICVDATGSVQVAFTIFDVISYVSEISKLEEGLLLLSAYSVENIIKSHVKPGTWRLLNEAHSLADSIKVLQEPLVRLIVGVNSLGAPTGAIVRSHRRY